MQSMRYVRPLLSRSHFENERMKVRALFVFMFYCSDLQYIKYQRHEIYVFEL